MSHLYVSILAVVTSYRLSSIGERIAPLPVYRLLIWMPNCTEFYLQSLLQMKTIQIILLKSTDTQPSPKKPQLNIISVTMTPPDLMRFPMILQQIQQHNRSESRCFFNLTTDSEILKSHWRQVERPLTQNSENTILDMHYQ